MHDVFLAAQQTGLPLNADVNDGDPIGMGMGTVCIHQGIRITASDAFLSCPHANLTIRTAAVVAKVILQGNVAKGVQCVDGRKFLARGEVILCGGAINSPQLL